VENLDLREYGLGQFDLTSKRNIYKARNQIIEYLKASHSVRKDEIVSALKADFGDRIDHDRFEDYLPMSVEEVKHISQDGLVTIGAHSRNHQILSRLGVEALSDEIVGSKQDLAEITNTEIVEFAYPNGRMSDINQQVVDITRRHFDCAVITEVGLNRPGDNKYLLRRIGIGRNMSLRKFRAILSGVYFWTRRKTGRLQEAG
jgi:peptidoglycan/xylan/chitin deacetylase (PgdA/CDA1 family)